ncbi:hypothetical protein [Mycolicibacterium baixiangningiae]|nr:hypothetical protein [Mycolicibacterium baixiangningiae]
MTDWTAAGGPSGPVWRSRRARDPKTATALWELSALLTGTAFAV